MAYPRLFEPFQIGNLHLKNRIAMAPMETHLGEPDGAVNNEVIAYYRERSLGGAGLIVTGVVMVMSGVVVRIGRTAREHRLDLVH